MFLSTDSLRRSFRRQPEALFETLEPRVVLYQSPMATGFVPLNQLENYDPTPGAPPPQNSVVRILTNVGRIDIELFEALAPAVTANFRSYIIAGLHDEQFFYSMGGGVLQAGLFKYNDGQGLVTINANAPIANGFSRSNLQRTLAMVPINSIQSQSQFIINLQDNPSLDTASGGYTVFAKVIQGWDIVTTIAGYATQNLNQQLLGTGSGPFGFVPVQPTYNPNIGPTEATLVKIIDIETIKAPFAPYYANTYVYPEGFRSNTTVERIDIVNGDIDDVNNPVNYFQVIVRYETGERDQVIFTGSLSSANNHRFSLKVNDFTLPGLNLVRPNVGYAFDVRTTRRAGVALNHRDSGATIGENFLITPQIPSPQFTRYNFPIARKSDSERAYLLIEELDGKNVTVNVLLFPDGGGQLYIPVQLEAFRRGGLSLNLLAPTNGSYSLYVTCLTPIAVSLSQYDTIDSQGTTYQGVQGLGRKEGALAGAYIATGGDAKIDFFYPGAGSIVIVDYTIFLTNGTVITPAPVTLTSSSRHSIVDLTAIPNLPRDTYFSITYAERQGVTAVSAVYRSKIAGDEVATPFQINATKTALFADGYTDPTLVASNGMSETVSVFNPYANAGVQFFFQLAYQFSDGTRIFIPGSSVLPLGPLARVDIKTSNQPTVMAKINSGPAFRFYSIQVITAAFSQPVPIGGVVTQLTRIHNTWGQSLTTTPGLDPSQPVVYLDNPEFNA